MKDALAQRPVSGVVLVGLILLLALAVFPHLWNLSVWVVLFFFLMAAIRVLAMLRPSWLPGRLLLVSLTAIGLINVFFHASLDGRGGGVSLLIAMLGLKLLEIRSRRDVYVAVFLGYFTVVTQFLFAQGLGLTFFMSLIVLGLTGVLVAMNRVQPAAGLGISSAMSDAGRLLLISVPAMLIMFVLFPRMQGPLWGLGLQQNRAITGITDRLRPGSISNLSQSRAVAFRARFEDGVPPIPDRRYWRGPVLWVTDGTEWVRGPQRHEPPAAPIDARQGIDYEVTLEPSRQRWLFALDLPGLAPPSSRLSPDLYLLADEPVEERFTYRTVSHLSYRTGPLSDEEFVLGLQLPPNISTRMRNLVDHWRLDSPRDQDLVAAALRYFREQPFVYTLRPPLLGANPADEFLFEARSGFCSHYATSFVLLMRLAGIPARVISGYQGGELNPHGGHLIVRQSDAHAWAEVWLEGIGWHRVDPTAAVAPQRVQMGIDPDLALDTGDPVIFEIDNKGLVANLIRQTGWLVDAAHLGWHRWVIGYSQDRQQDLLDRLGLGFLEGYRLALATVIGTGLALLLGALLLKLRGRIRPDPVQTAYQRLKRKLADKGLEIPGWFGPRRLGLRAREAFPRQAGRIDETVALYISLRYGRNENPVHTKRLQRLVRSLRLE